MDLNTKVHKFINFFFLNFFCKNVTKTIRKLIANIIFYGKIQKNIKIALIFSKFLIFSSFYFCKYNEILLHYKFLKKNYIKKVKKQEKLKNK